MMTVKLDKTTHDRQHFDCGVESLNNYLKVMASQQSQKDNTRTFVLVEEQNTERVIGYYTLIDRILSDKSLFQIEKWPHL